MDFDLNTYIGRDDPEKLETLKEKISREVRIPEILDATPLAGFIMNDKRQVVLSNKVLEQILGKHLEEILGLRPGEIFNCVRSTYGPDGCGTGPFCRFCDIFRVIRMAKTLDKQVEDEGKLLVERNGIEETLDLNIIVTPVNVEGEKFYLTFINDVSQIKKKELLEKTFFHDVMNLASGLQNLLEVLSRDYKLKNNQIMELLSHQSERLIEEIKNQQLIMDAESGNVERHLAEVPVKQIYIEAYYSALSLKESRNKNILIEHLEDEHTVNTDPVLLKRIILNLLRNALEATSPGGEISFSVKTEEDKAVFEVVNRGTLSEDMQSRIFQRGFSTKGQGRGLGTFGAKLLAERYLDGKVDFKCCKDNKIKFYVEIPLRKS